MGMGNSKGDSRRGGERGRKGNGEIRKVKWKGERVGGKDSQGGWGVGKGIRRKKCEGKGEGMDEGNEKRPNWKGSGERNWEGEEGKYDIWNGKRNRIKSYPSPFEHLISRKFPPLPFYKYPHSLALILESCMCRNTCVDFSARTDLCI